METAMSEKRAWRCRACRQEHTPRCPTCRVVISGPEAAAGRCQTCGSPITAAVYTCPHCQTERALQPPALPLRPWHGRDLGIKGLQALRILVGTTQMAGLILFAVSCSAAVGGATPRSPNAPSLPTLQFVGFLVFTGLMPVQIVLAKVIKTLSHGSIAIGERRPQRR
ncbi:MAG: hypothetical protein HY688_00415 [Chloroflexi bacterium]|nr:hypothetical protein [Chloroflexota bacterium]